MRGKALSSSSVSSWLRITPAHAGKRSERVHYYLTPEDHPRACGEKLLVILEPPAKVGSPPRMRGKVLFSHLTKWEEWITPAHAGKSFSYFFCTRCFRDHPRACGEKLRLHPAGLQLLGSPPRMRGKVMDAFRKAFGIQDHPRACGEKNFERHSVQAVLGSPPRMRGKD